MPDLEQICQLAEMNPNALFLHINFENHKEMCDALNIKVLPFFRFYRGEEGRACSFSCTNATVSDQLFLILCLKVLVSYHVADLCFHELTDQEI